MNNETKKGKLVPELRFPGFEGEWPIQPLSNFLHEHKTKSDGKSRVHSVSVSKGVVDQVEYLGRSFAASDTSKYNLAKPNDIIYTKSPTGSFPYGIVKMNKKPYNVIVSPLYGVYSPTNKYIGYILDSYFESPERTNTYLSTLIQKGAKNTIQITNSTFISKNVCFPTDEAEQQKIAECLSSVDDLIQAEADQLQALKDHKKGLMQQLFPQEGETTPKLRFPGFEGEWEEKKLGEVCDITAGGDVPKQKFSKEKTNIFNIPIISNGVGDNSIYGYTDFPKITKKAVTVAARGTIGYSEYRDYPYYPIIRLLSVVSKDSTILDTKFLSFILSLQKYDVADAGIPQLTVPMISSITISFPSLPEQQKIASCLSSLDDLIAAQQEKVEALREHKKGLMQKLFPTIN